MHALVPAAPSDRGLTHSPHSCLGLALPAVVLHHAHQPAGGHALSWHGSNGSSQAAHRAVVLHHVHRPARRGSGATCECGCMRTAARWGCRPILVLPPSYLAATRPPLAHPANYQCMDSTKQISTTQHLNLRTCCAPHPRPHPQTSAGNRPRPPAANPSHLLRVASTAQSAERSRKQTLTAPT